MSRYPSLNLNPGYYKPDPIIQSWPPLMLISMLINDIFRIITEILWKLDDVSVYCLVFIRHYG